VAVELGERVDELWWKYAATRDHAVRDQLIVHYAPLVKFVASRLAAGLPQNVEQADLVSYGIFGLIDAIDRFDPERGNKFETYAMQRIKGAILDELRSYDWVPRSVRAKARSIEKALAKLESELGRTPTEVELAGELTLELPQLQAMLTQISGVGLIALDEMLTGSGDRNESVALVDTIPDAGDGPVGLYETKEMKQLLAAGINGMGDREKLVLVLYYFEHFTLAEIGKVLGVTESRVCQIHTKAVMQLRLYLQRRLDS
jgi:RNA polymerase sigma factor for flagellar operon FliA